MAAEIIKVVDAVSEAKDVDREVLFEAIENAIESATKKKYADNMDVKVTIDRETGDYKTYRRWLVFADESRELEDPDSELRMIDAVDVDKTANPGEFVHEEIESVDFGRIGAQIAKQVIVQKVREAEKQKTIELFKDNVGELVSGVVKRMDRNGFYIDIGNNSEAFLPRREMIYKEAIRPQDRIKAILKDINTDLKGPPLILSRVIDCVKNDRYTPNVNNYLFPEKVFINYLLVEFIISVLFLLVVSVIILVYIRLLLYSDIYCCQ